MTLPRSLLVVAVTVALAPPAIASDPVTVTGRSVRLVSPDQAHEAWIATRTTAGSDGWLTTVLFAESPRGHRIVVRETYVPEVAGHRILLENPGTGWEAELFHGYDGLPSDVEPVARSAQPELYRWLAQERPPDVEQFIKFSCCQGVRAIDTSPYLTGKEDEGQTLVDLKRAIADLRAGVEAPPELVDGLSFLESAVVRRQIPGFSSGEVPIVGILPDLLELIWFAVGSDSPDRPGGFDTWSTTLREASAEDYEHSEAAWLADRIGRNAKDRHRGSGSEN